MAWPGSPFVLAQDTGQWSLYALALVAVALGLGSLYFAVRKNGRNGPAGEKSVSFWESRQEEIVRKVMTDSVMPYLKVLHRNQRVLANGMNQILHEYSARKGLAPHPPTPITLEDVDGES